MGGRKHATTPGEHLVEQLVGTGLVEPQGLYLDLQRNRLNVAKDTEKKGLESVILVECEQTEHS